MKDLAEGGLPNCGAEVAVWFDEAEDVVVVQCDFMDLNFYSSDFSKMVDILTQAKLNLDSCLREE